MLDEAEAVNNVTLIRSQQNQIVLTFDMGKSLLTAHKYRLYQLDNDKAKFRNIFEFTGNTERLQKIQISPTRLIADQGSFYVLDLSSSKSSYSTGLVDLSEKSALNPNFSESRRGIQPLSCALEGDKLTLSWVVSESVAKSCQKGFTVVVDGPSSNVESLPCSANRYEMKQSNPGLYRVRVESRENGELGAYFLVEIGDDSSRICVDTLVGNSSYVWASGLTIQWEEAPVVRRAKLLIDSYEVIVKKDALLVSAAKALRIETLTSSDLVQRYSFEDVTEGNYSVEINPIVSAAQATSAFLLVESQLPEVAGFFSNLLRSPLFIAIISSVVLIIFIIGGAVLFVCLKKQSPRKSHPKACFARSKREKADKPLTKTELFGDFPLGDENDANWNQTLAQTLLPDFAVMKQNGGSREQLKMSYMTTVSNGHPKHKMRSNHTDNIHLTTSHNAPDIQSGKTIVNSNKL